MGTNVEQIYDIALVTINDYQIDALAKVDYNAFLQYLRGFLITGLPEFKGDVLGELAPCTGTARRPGYSSISTSCPHAFERMMPSMIAWL